MGTRGKGQDSTTLERVDVKRKRLEDYRRFVPEELIDKVHEVARELQGLRVLHLNSTAGGGGVAELLNSVVPLERDCGLEAEWRIICPDQNLFAVTKEFHNAMQGRRATLTEKDKDVYLGRNEHCAAMLNPSDYDAIVIHDPQPAAIPTFLAGNTALWIWRCHVDSSAPDPDVWAFLRNYVSQYDAAVFTMQAFVPPNLTAGPSLRMIPPAIDPLSPKNRHLPGYLCREEVAEFGIDLSRPLMLQVARFDPWKDPQGVIEAYRRLKTDLPELQLALVGSMASDDPEGWTIYSAVRDEAAKDPDVHVFTNLTGVGPHEVNAFQRVADVVVQKSLREGFGLVVSEAVWKGTPVVAGNTGGIPLQIQDGVGGFLVNSVTECAERVGYLIGHPEEAEMIARRGRELVQRQFLMPRLVLDEMQLLAGLVSGQNEG